MLKALYKMLSGRLGAHSERLSAFYLCRHKQNPAALHGAAKTGKKQAFLMQNCRKKIKSLKSY